jgi:hypothetical protein
LSADLSKAYELLGVKPGVSIRELKAAHRDLAKVWHPDRFLHDPRLQEKAQEKLKEINEAYDLISSGKVPRSANPPPRAREREAPRVYYTEQQPYARRGSNWRSYAVALLIFAAVFAVTTGLLLQRRSKALQRETESTQESAELDQAQPARPDSNTRAEARGTTPKSNTENTAAPEVTAPVALPAQPAPAVTTVTVTIDPETGLLAKPECPVRTRMTYPSGSQPSGYCTLSHAPPPKESRLKSIGKTVKRALD